MENNDDKLNPAATAAGGKPTTDENPNPAPPPAADLAPPPSPPAAAPPRRPFTSLSQVDADLALARALQEQERAYMMLRMNGGEGSDYGSSDSGSYVEEGEFDAAAAAAVAEEDGAEHEGDEEGEEEEEDGEEGSDYSEDAFDAMDQALNPADFENDEAYARALQEVEGQELANQLMALTGLNGWRSADLGDHGGIDQDAWEDVDPDELSYEELIALGEVVGTENRGLSAETIASLPSVNYKTQSAEDGNTDQCVICRLDYENGESLVVLQCRHNYHPECIEKWLQINKVCPVCSAEVSTSGSSD